VTQVEVLSLTGRKIATVEMGQTRQAGQNTILWRGNNANGHLIPVGVYLIRINAQDEEGRQVQATRTVIVR
jgi:flagellar hook assembly protein FlgD